MSWKPEHAETVTEIAGNLRAEGVTEAEIARRIAAAAGADDRFTADIGRFIRAGGSRG